jgi:hypothetical protein
VSGDAPDEVHHDGYLVINAMLVDSQKMLMMKAKIRMLDDECDRLRTEIQLIQQVRQRVSKKGASVPNPCHLPIITSAAAASAMSYEQLIDLFEQLHHTLALALHSSEATEKATSSVSTIP